MDLLTVLSPGQIAVLATVVAGVVELYGRAVSRDWRVVGKIVVAVVTGAGIAFTYGVDLPTALAVGFAAPGGISILAHLGNKSPAEPTSLVEKAPQ